MRALAIFATVEIWQGYSVALEAITAHQHVILFTDRTRSFVWHWVQSLLR
jgi:hypothetical protein